MKKTIYILTVLLFSSLQLFSQQLTRVAVVDLSKILEFFPKDSIQISELENQKKQVQSIINNETENIKKLNEEKTLAESKNDLSNAKRLSDLIDTKILNLKNFAAQKQEELNTKAKNISSTNIFAPDLLGKIQKTAEKLGYSIVVDSSSRIGNPILWYSPAIDITDEVVEALKNSSIKN